MNASAKCGLGNFMPKLLQKIWKAGFFKQENGLATARFSKIIDLTE